MERTITEKRYKSTSKVNTTSELPRKRYIIKKWTGSSIENLKKILAVTRLKEEK